MITVLGLFIVLTLSYYIYKQKAIEYDFEDHGIKYMPGVTFFGNFLESAFYRRHFSEDIDEVYNVFPYAKYVGLTEYMRKAILIRDPNIIRDVTINDFDHFTDHVNDIPEEIDALFGGTLLLRTEERWRELKNTLSPAFSGPKLRRMVPWTNRIAKEIVKYLKEIETDIVDVDDLSRRYTSDVIASMTFGLKTNSVRERENEFYVNGETLLSSSSFQRYYRLFVSLCPDLAKKFKIQLYLKKTTEFYKNLFYKTIQYREESNTQRPDFIQMLFEAYSGTLKSDDKNDNDYTYDEFPTVNNVLKSTNNMKNWTVEEVADQILLFFMAGYRNTATALIAAIHELALHPDFEDRLYVEILEFNRNITYENINKLKFLDCILNETLRISTSVHYLYRKCTKPYLLPPDMEGGQPYQLHTGDIVYLSVGGIHKDAKYYPDPEKFDPTRFEGGNKHRIEPFTFMPFGTGPRDCIGSKLAIMIVKIFLFHLVKDFKIRKCSKTTDPIELDPEAGREVFKIKGGSYVRLVPRYKYP